MDNLWLDFTQINRRGDASDTNTQSSRMCQVVDDVFSSACHVLTETTLDIILPYTK